MPAIKITKSAVDKLRPETTRVVYTDTELKGFAVRVEPSGVKSYVFRYREGGGGRAAKSRLVVIGRHGDLTPDQARKAAEAMKYGVRVEGKSPAAERDQKREEDGHTVAVVGAEWLKYSQGPLKPKTIKDYALALRKMDPFIGSRALNSVTRKDVQKMQDKISETAPIMANRVLAALGALWTFAERRGYVDEDRQSPTRRIGKNKERKRERALTAPEFARLGAILRLGETEGFPAIRKSDSKHFPAGQRFKLDPAAVGAIRLMLLTGCRIGEVLRLEWSEVDFEAGVIRLPDERSKTDARTVPLGDVAVALLAGLPRDGRFVFGGNVARSDLKRPWMAIRRAAGLEWLSAHYLRHSLATAAFEVGVGRAEVGYVIGHKPQGVTAGYMHPPISTQRKWATAIARWVDAAMRGEV